MIQRFTVPISNLFVSILIIIILSQHTLQTTCHKITTYILILKSKYQYAKIKYVVLNCKQNKIISNSKHEMTNDTISKLKINRFDDTIFN